MDKFDKLFRFSNAFPLPLWLAMIFAPTHRWTERAGRSSTVFGIAALNYVASLILAMRNGDAGELPDFTSLEGIRAGLSTRPGALGAWNHMIALDLFTGAWIYRQSRRLNAPAWVRVPALLFTFLSGPFGLLLFLLWRTLGAEKGEVLPGVDM